jgi:MinD-like ATPase involved in chromosome partitioning or flagellar assembly
LAALTLARALGKDARVVLVDLAVATPNLAAVATDRSAPGIADLVNGTASFSDVITRDRLSRVHIVNAGQVGDDAASMLASPHLVVAVEALARSYDHVVVDAGAVSDGVAERLARLAPKAVLIATGTEPPATQAAQLRLAAAGVADVTVLTGAPGDLGEVPPTPVAA